MARVIRLVVVLLVLGGVGSFLFVQAKTFFTPPCDEPVTYSVATYDKRFGISEAAFSDALNDAAKIWNDAAGKTIVVAGDGGVLVHMRYGEVQKTSELGETIDTEQKAYDAKRAQVESLKREFTAAKRKYEVLVTQYEAQQESYESEVTYWNQRGGAPEKEYAELQADRVRLEEKQQEVNAQTTTVNALAGEINDRVDELNVIAGQLNKKVHTFNSNAEEDFEQGEYLSDESGEQIVLYEFTNETELRRVLAHEFGHALGLDHVENPNSIMYSYNIGTEFDLSEEDVAELNRACAFP